MSLRVREAGAADAPAISALNADVQAVHAEALPDLFKQPSGATFPPEAARAHLSRPGYVAFIAELDGEPVGYVTAEAVDQPETARRHALRMMYVHHLSVRPAARRRGVGRALLDAVKARGRAQGITRLALDAWAFNDEALAFFRRYGLVPYNVKLWNRDT